MGKPKPVGAPARQARHGAPVTLEQDCSESSLCVPESENATNRGVNRRGSGS